MEACFSRAVGPSVVRGDCCDEGGQRGGETTMSLGNGAVLLVAALAPPAVMLLVRHRPPTITVAKLLD